MARATKKPPRNKDSSKFKDAVDASAEQDAPSPRSGVAFDESGSPVVIEDLTLEEKATAGQQLGELNIKLRELEQDGRDTASAQRKKVKALKKKIADLSDEAFEGVRKKSPQGTLPGTEAGA